MVTVLNYELANELYSTEQEAVELFKKYGFSKENPMTVEWIMDNPQKAVIEIPDTAKYKAKSMADGYEQISYKWNDGTYKYEVRWHTRTSGGTRRTRQYLGNSKNNSRKWRTLEGVSICWIQGIMKDMKAKEK